MPRLGKVSQLGLLFAVLVVWAGGPIWAVDYFIPQDGPAHVYSASLMLRLLGGDGVVTQLFMFNPWTVSNSAGHWLLALLLTVVSPFTATKIMVTMTYAGVVAAVGFLRFSTAGRDGAFSSLLIGAAIAFNWLWLSGLYNFLLGAIGFAVTLGLFYRWRERLSGGRTVGLAVLLLFVYTSHIVTFGALAAGLGLLAVAARPSERGRACLGVFAALLPAVLLAVFYGLPPGDPTVAGESVFPVWRRLANPWSVPAWLSHIRTADPFVIISRRTLPFMDVASGAFAVFTPLLWLLVAVAALTWGTLWRIKSVRQIGSSPRLPLLVIFVACVLAAAFGPDDFGTSHGTLLRERFALLAAMCFVPLYRTGGPESAGRNRFAHMCLGGLILFQTMAVWEYARETSRDATEFLAIGAALGGRESVASVIVLENGHRFHSNPTAEISNFLGIGRSTVVLDNYEIGYTLFPVVARRPEDRRLAFELTRTNIFDEVDSADVWDEKLAGLGRVLQSSHSRIETLLLWRRNARVEAVLSKWYEPQPFFEHGRGRLYRRRPEFEASTTPMAAKTIPAGRSTDGPGQDQGSRRRRP